MSADKRNLNDSREAKIVVKVQTSEDVTSEGVTLEIVSEESAPEVTIQTRERVIGEDWEIQREKRKTMVLRTYLMLQSVNFVLLWFGILHPMLAITANIYFTWRIKGLL
jgi:hypothetical protein